MSFLSKIASPFNWILKKLGWLLNSFDNKTDGASARKLSALFAIVCVSGYITYKHCDKDNVVTLVIVWLSFACLCLGMVTAQQLIELKSDKKDTNTPPPDGPK